MKKLLLKALTKEFLNQCGVISLDEQIKKVQEAERENVGVPRKFFLYPNAQTWCAEMEKLECLIEDQRIVEVDGAYYDCSQLKNGLAKHGILLVLPAKH
jgi:hypothetical protein